MESRFYSEYKDRGDGFTVHQLLAEDDFGRTPTTTVLSEWAEEYEVTFPVLADPAWGFCYELLVDAFIPTYVLVDQDLLIRKKGLFLSAFHGGIRDLLGIDQ